MLDDNQGGGGLGPSDLATNSVAQSEIATDGVAATEIQDDSIDAGEIVDFGRTNQDVGILFGEVNVADRAGYAEGVFVDTNTSSGTAADKAFRLVVC